MQIEIPKGTTLEPVKLSQLVKTYDDLVKMDSCTDPFIVHNLRERCKVGEIYVRRLLLSPARFACLEKPC